MNPTDYYNEQCARQAIQDDPQQRQILQQLEVIFGQLLQEHQRRSRWLALLHKPHLVQGLYVWGSVGVGKTFLMDCFYQCLPFPNKMRMHFHAFMQWVHQQLRPLQGKKNPLQLIAKRIAQKQLVLCFDEFTVADIADAMILARLFQELFAQGVCLVTTSNTEPDDLYKHGLQRRSFLPTIALLKQHTAVMHVTSTIDYRLRHLQQSGVFYTPNDAAAHEHMNKSFMILANSADITNEPIEINGRTIPIKKQSGELIWFDFEVICHTPRSQHDYLEIAKKYHTVFISNIPMIPATANNTILLFIRMIDVFYDNHIRLIFSAADTVDKIYTDGKMINDYTRTRSRLIEMQSEKYISIMPVGRN